MAKTYDSSNEGRDVDEGLQYARKIVDHFTRKSEPEKQAFIARLQGLADKHADNPELASAFRALAGAFRYRCFSNLNLKTGSRNPSFFGGYGPF